MPDLSRIKSNVAKMASMNAPEEDIDGYIASEGVSLDDVRNFRPNADRPGNPVVNFAGDLGRETMKQANQFAYGADDEAMLGAFDAMKNRRIFNMDPGKPENFMQGAARIAGRGAGFMLGAPMKAGEAFLSKVAPNAGKVASEAIKFGAGRAASTPIRLAGGTSTPSDEALAIGTDTALGGALPIASEYGTKVFNAMRNAPTRIPDKIFRGGLSSDEASRIAEEYGNSNAALADKIKQNLRSNIQNSEDNFSKVIDQIPLSKRTRLNNFRKELTNSLEGMFRGGHLRSDIPKEDTAAIRDLIDMYKDPREVFDKTEFLRRRSRLADLQQSTNGEVAAKASRLKDALEQDAEDFGFGPIREAKQNYAIAKQNEGKFLNRNTGDLKLATEQRLNRIGMDKPLSGQEMEHIQNLGEYTGVPISDEARAINRLNQSAERWKAIKKGLVVGALSLSGLGGAKNLFWRH